jgi:hypothetical protein
MRISRRSFQSREYMKKLFLVALLLACTGGAFAQIARTSRGKEFYGMIMKNSGATGGANTQPYFRVFLSSPIAATATVEITDGSFSKNVTITPNVVSTVQLPFTAEVSNIEIPESKAIHIVADTDISVYIIYHKIFSSDSYMALPVTSLGNEYTAVCYPSCESFGPDAKASEFGIVATEDNTTVTITPNSTTTNNHPVGIPFSVLLNKGETYLVYGDPNDGSSDLTGSSVVATNPIAFLSGHDRTEIIHDQGVSRNCLVEQIPSNGTLGTSFITVPYAGRVPQVPDYFRVVAAIDSTAVLQNGAPVATINAGQFYDFYTENPTQIQTNNPVILAQYSQSATDNNGNYPSPGDPNSLTYPWDPTMMIIPPTQQFLNDYIFANSVDAAFTSNYVNVVIPDTAASSLMLDGAPVGVPFTKIPGSGFSYAQVPTSQGSHHIAASAPFGLYMYGFGPADAYANTGGASFKVLNGLLVTTSNINFGSVDVDSCKDSTILFKNVGQAPITVWKLTFAGSGAGDFTITGGGPPFTIAPGDSHEVHVNFCPSATGLRGIVNVQISSNAAEHPIITLQGIGLKAGLQASVQSLDCDTARDDYGDGRLDCTRDTTIVIRNTSNLTVNVSSLSITGANATDFSIISPNGGFSLVPGDSISVVIMFQPSADGIRVAALQSVSNAATELNIPLQGEAVSAQLISVPPTYNFGVVKVGATAKGTIVLKNTTAYPILLDPNYFRTNAGGDYLVVQWNGAQYVGGKLEIPPFDSLVVVVSFTPSVSNPQPGQMFYKYSDCRDTNAHEAVSTLFNGNGAYPILGINPNIVDYHRVKIGKQKDSILALQNFGIVTANVKQYAIAGTDAADFLMDTVPVPPDSLLANENDPLGVRFAPLTLGAKHAQLVVTSDDSIAQVVADLYGNATPSSYNVITATDTIHGKIGDTIEMPVHLLTALDDADIDKYHIAVSYDSTMLYPIGVSSDSTWDVMSFPPLLTYGSGFSDIVAQAPGNTTLSGAGTLFYVKMLVLLGDAMQTPLTLTAARYTDNTNDSTAVISAVHHGLFILDGYCGGQQGLVQIAGSYSLGNISPNPLSNSAQIPYDIAIAGHVQLGMYNMLGEQALQFVNEDQQPGHYVAFLNGHSLPEGAYILVLQSGRYRETRRVMVLR